VTHKKRHSFNIPLVRTYITLVSLTQTPKIGLVRLVSLVRATFTNQQFKIFIFFLLKKRLLIIPINVNTYRKHLKKEIYMKTLSSFRKENTARRRKSKIDKFRKDVIFLKNNYFSIKQILNFLKMNDIEVSERTLIRYCKRHENEKIDKKEISKALRAFLKDNEGKGRKSELYDYRDKIQALYDNKYKVEQIQEFLLQNEVKISITAIYNFLKKSKNTTEQNKSSFIKEKMQAPNSNNSNGKKEVSKSMAAFMNRNQEIIEK